MILCEQVKNYRLIFFAPGLRNQAKQHVTMYIFSAAKKLDAVFVVEVSTNVNEIQLTRFKEIISETIEQFRIHKDYVRVGIMTYAARPKGVVFLSDFKSQGELALVVKSLQLDDSTPDVVNALMFLKDKMFNKVSGARDGVSREVFYLTSGKVPKTQIDQVKLCLCCCIL